MLTGGNHAFAGVDGFLPSDGEGNAVTCSYSQPAVASSCEEACDACLGCSAFTVMQAHEPDSEVDSRCFFKDKVVTASTQHNSRGVMSWDFRFKCYAVTGPMLTGLAAVGSATDGVGGFDELDGCRTVATFVIGASTYAIVASSTDDGVQLIDVSDPASPTAVGSATDGDKNVETRMIVTPCAGYAPGSPC